jgi:hypothetical protein
MDRKLAFGAAGALALVAIVYFVARGGEEDPETRIRRTIGRTAKAAEEQDLGGVMEAISESFKSGGADRRDIPRFIFAQLRQAQWRRVAIVNIDVELKDEKSAHARVKSILARGDVGEGELDRGALEKLAQAVRTDAFVFELDFVREDDDEWRVIKAEYKSVSPKDLL